MLKTLNTEVIGLDPDSHAVKAVRATRHAGRITFREFERVRMPVDTAERRDVLHAFVRQKGWRGMPCVVAARAEAVMLQAMTVPGDDGHGGQREILKCVERLQELSPDETVHAWSRQGRDAGLNRILIAAARQDDVFDAFQLASDAGLTVIDVVSGAVAMHVAIVKSLPAEEKTLICIDIGQLSTEIVIGTESNVQFARHLPLGVEWIEGAGEDGAQQRRATWLDELKQTFDAFTDSARRSAPQLGLIVISGRGAILQNMKSDVENTLRKETLCFSDIARHVGGMSPDVFASAVGLARVGLERTDCPSLLPVDIRERIGLDRRIPHLLATTAACVVAMCILVAGARVKLNSLNRILGDRLAAVTSLTQQRQALHAHRLTNMDIVQQLIPFRISIHNGVIIEAVIHALGNTKHPDDWIIHISDSKSYSAQTGKPESATVPDLDADLIGKFVIEGCTPVEDLSTVRQMIAALRDSPGIESADLLGDDQLREDAARDARWTGTGAHVFAIEVAVGKP